MKLCRGIRPGRAESLARPQAPASAQRRAELLPRPHAVLVEQHRRGDEEGLEPPQRIGHVAIALGDEPRALQAEVCLVETTALEPVLENVAVLDERGAVIGEE